MFSSSGVSLDTVSSAEFAGIENKKALSIGKTAKYSASGLNVDVSSLNGDGYAIKNVGDDIFVIAGDSALAYVYAAQGLLHELIGYEAYAIDEIVYDGSDEIEYSPLDVVSVPDFRYRYMYNMNVTGAEDPAGYKNILRNNGVNFSPIGGGHTIFRFLPPETYYATHPEWYTSTDKATGQLCWSNAEMLDELSKAVIKEYDNLPPTATHIMVAQNDGRDWCTCEACTASLNKYGTNSAVVVKGINKLARDLKAHIASSSTPDRQAFVGTFAYTSTERPPVTRLADGTYAPVDDDVIMEDNTFVQVAPIDTDYSRNFYDEKNVTYANNFRGWNAIAKNIIVWNYNTNFSNYFVPFMTYNVLADNYKFLKENGVVSIMEQGAHNSKQIGFMELKNYISSKVAWNVNASVSDLTDEFFEAYYRDAAPFMKSYFDEYRAWYNVLEEKETIINGGIYAKYESVPDAFPLPLVARWESYLDDAKISIAYLKDVDENRYNALYARIDKENLFMNYVRLTWYAERYSESELTEMRASFKEKCELYDLARESELSALETLYASWGLL